MASDGQDWRGTGFRKKVIAQIEEAVRQAGNPITKSSHEMENHVFQKAKTREEYLALVARLILHIKEINSQKEKKAAMVAASALSQPHGIPQGTAPLQQQQQQQPGPGMQDPINALQTLARQGGGHNVAMGHQPQQAVMGIGLSQEQPILPQQLQSFLTEPRPGSYPQRAPGLQNQQYQMHQKLMQQRLMQQQHQQLMQQRAMHQQQQQQQPQHQAQQVPTLQRQDAFIVTSPQQPITHIPPVQNQGVGQPQTQMSFATPGPYPSPQQVVYGQSPVSQPGSIPQQMTPSPAQPTSFQPSPSPQPTVVPSPVSNRPLGVASPGTNLNTPGNPGSVGTVASPASRPPGEDQAYLDKLKQLSKYIEPLRRMVNKIDKDEDGKKDQLSKMKNLLDILSDSSRRLPMTTLLKCESVLERLDLHPKGSVGSLTPQQMIGGTGPSEQHMCQPLLDAVAALIQSPMLNHTLHRTFGPAMISLNGPAIKVPSSLPKKRKRESDSPENEIPDILQGEVARLDTRFRVNLNPANSSASKTIHLTCHLQDKNLPSVPPIQVTVPDGYPSTSPTCDLDLLDYDSTPFLQAIQKLLSIRLLRMPDRFSLTALLNTWEMTVRHACSPVTIVQ